MGWLAGLKQPSVKGNIGAVCDEKGNDVRLARNASETQFDIRTFQSRILFVALPQQNLPGEQLIVR
jgi:hypothetical protein